MTRPGAADGEFKGFRVDRLVGGLETSMPPHMLDKSKSPDLLNVVLNNNGAEKRGGFIPVIREHPSLSSLKNRGHHGRMRIRNTTSASDSDVLIVPGAAYAGHRQIYEAINAACAVDLFIRIDDLTTHHVGNQRTAGAGEVYNTGGDSTPYRIRVRPILSKGPVKRWYNEDATYGPAENSIIRWRLPADPEFVSLWGPAAEAHMPWCLFLHQDNSGNWEFQVAWHSKHTASGQFDLLRMRIPYTILRPKLATTYHLVFSHEHGDSAIFRVGVVSNRTSLPIYVSTTTITNAAGLEVNYSDYEAPAASTTGPVQLFDCPQEFIAAPNARAARPPGLEYSSATDGDYWFACKRFEGYAEDITVWTSHRCADVPTALDRFTKLDQDAFARSDIASYWSMAQEGRNYVQESTGRGNHLYFSPAGPIYDPTLGGVREQTKASWWFNGVTSYALVDLDVQRVNTAADELLVPFNDDGNPNWRYRLNLASDGSGTWTRTVGFFQRIVLGNLAHGIEITFWPDSIEPRFEQVLFEIHGVIRVAINQDGRIVGYCRTNGTGVAGAYLYQDAFALSTTRVVPGRRYTVTLFRDTGGTTLRMLVNGTQEDSEAVDASSPNGWLLSGITIGMGSYRCNGYTNSNAGAYPTDGVVPTPSVVSMDPRSGFMGRVESCRILVGELRNDKNYKDEDDDDYQLAQKLLWRIPNGSSTTTLTPESENGEEYPANIAAGHALLVSGKRVPYIDRHFRFRDVHSVYANSGSNSVVPIVPAILDIEDYGFFPDASSSEDGWGTLHGSMKTYFTLARWTLDKDDGDVGYAGLYQNYVEASIDTNDVIVDTFRSTHIQLSQVDDEVGVLAHLERRCIESDLFTLQYIGGGSFGVPEISLRHSGKPYHYKSPRELAPTWAPGLCVPLTEQNPISLIAEWQHQKSNESFLVIACGRQVYWAKSPWRNESPYEEESPHSLWGIYGYAQVLCSALEQQFTFLAGAYSTVTLDFWIKPQRLDSTRVIALKGLPEAPVINYAVATVDGALLVFGTAAGRTWVYREGAFTGTTYRPEMTLRDNAWNHVYLLIGANAVTGSAGASVVAWVNGHKLTMVADPNYDAITAQPPDAGNLDLYLMGLKESHRDFRSASVVGTSFTFGWSAMQGFLSDFRLTNEEEEDFSSAASVGIVPRERRVDSDSTYLLLPLNEGTDWSLTNIAANTSDDHGSIFINELFLIGNDDEPLEESSKDRYDYVVFRDELLITNGKSYPQRISFTSFSDPKGPFRRYRLGMEAPFTGSFRGVGFSVGVDNPLNVFDVAGAYDFYVSFLNHLDEESEPTLVHRHFLFGVDPDELAGFRLVPVPRSPDPQVKKRRLYVSSIGGGTPLFHSDIHDNTTYDYQLFGLPFDGDAVVTGDRLPAPKARHLAVGGGGVFLGYLTESESGGNAFAWSSLFSIAYYPVQNQTLVDSVNGKSIAGFNTMLGRLYVMKGDSTWQFSLQGAGNPAEAQAYLQPINESVGLPGGLLAFDNLLFGTGERGPYAFDGVNHIYLGQALKDDYSSLGLTQSSARLDEAFISMFGAFERPNSQYWISVRQPGHNHNETIYVLHRSIGDQQAWTKLLAPKHSYMTESIISDASPPGVIIGTLSGQVLRYVTDVTIDGHGDTKQFNALTILAGEVSDGTLYSLTAIAQEGMSFDMIGNGLRGCVVRVNGVDRIIERVDGLTIYWREPLQVFAGGPFFIGAYSAYYTTGWLEVAKYGLWAHGQFIDLDFAPSDTTLTIDNHIANTLPTDRAFPADPETQTTSLATGYLTAALPMQTHNRGRYVRLRFGTYQHKDPFLVTGIGIRYTDTGMRGKPS